MLGFYVQGFLIVEKKFILYSSIGANCTADDSINTWQMGAGQVGTPSLVDLHTHTHTPG